MKKVTKKFLIGEYAIGGIIQVEIKDDLVIIKALDWENNDVVRFGQCSINQPDAEDLIDDFLYELTSSYYADQIMTYIKTKVTFKQREW
jgi:hypothetical protein